MTFDPFAFLGALLRAAIAAVDPAACVPAHLPAPPSGRTIVVGAGKAAAAMAHAVEDGFAGQLEGLVVTRYGHARACRRIGVVEAAHPVPDASGLKAAERILAVVRDRSAEDLILALISGGGSALLTLPAPGLALEELSALTGALLKSGATIAEINCVRKHLSAIAGGRLAAAAQPARVLTLAISDVAGDDPAAIASGPTVPDPTTLANARAVLAKYRIEPPPAIGAHLARPASETPKPGDPRLARAEFRLIASARDALGAAATRAKAEGLAILDLGDKVEGEAREVGRAHARLALRLAAGKGPLEAPAVVISGGETTVTVKGKGRGGRNAEYLLALALALDGAPGIFALAADTDGIDGSEDNAGARIGPDTLARARAAGFDPRARLDDNDAYTVLARLGDLVTTGPTLTNVNDFRAILVAPHRPPGRSRLDVDDDAEMTDDRRG
ncbi:MAG: glycerate kinase type-2 family protein [Pseudomonadota bacterium]